MTKALNETGHPIYFSMCEWGESFPWLWAQSVGNSWRITPDITSNWYSIMAILDVNAFLGDYASPGAWNDPDVQIFFFIF
jgi:alpha-galactosidase